MNRPQLANKRLRSSAAGLGAALAASALAACGGGSPAAVVPKTVHVADFRAAAVNPVTVSPLPGTGDAGPATQISFLGEAATKVADVKVTGSISGSHSGKLEAYSTATGESFLPSQPFRSGEKVTVTARVTQGGSSATVHTSFSVGFQVASAQTEFPNNPGSAADVQHYRSAPTLTPSTVHVTTPPRTGASAGDFFLAPYQGSGSPGPMIVDQTGSLVWFHALPPGESATNFEPQTYGGHTVLTWWQGRILKLGFGQGSDVIYSTSYRPIRRVRAGNGYSADLHQFTLTPQGTAWLDAFDPVELDLTSLGGSAHAVVNDSIVQEVDVKTGLVMWEWHALGHIPLRDSEAPMPHTSGNWDYVHVNSIDPGPDGLLLSARNTWTIYNVDMHTGAFIWRIGGKYPGFKRGPGTSFYWQHDARWQPGGLVSIFDNGSSPPHEKQSRGLVLRPDTATHTVTLVKQFTNPNSTLLASSQGDMLNLPGGNWLMGYGGLPNFTEYDPSGHVLFDATLGTNVQDFRTFVAPWSAQPPTVPQVAAQSAGAGQVTVEASWNGATTVSAWKVLAGAGASSLSAVATVPKAGFETTTTIHTTEPEVAVAALDSSGRTLASSPTVAPTG
ncbi:MAG TPA: arylsulfotransferase family protein [Solirubrobacteraceae bacterium]|nr:arylsulfotransferase family protein [Solirubrobacteraceae bacterium]